MSYSSFSDNDDDLFDDSAPSFTSSSSNFNSTSDDIQSLIEGIDKKEFEKIDRMFFRSKVALTLFEGSNEYIFSNDSYNRTIFNTLNSLTDNQFQYHLYADVLEESISRRVIIRDFLLACVDNTNDQFLKSLSEIVEVDIDQRFLDTYFFSFLEILNFVISENVDLYKKLCEQINRQPMSQIVDNTINQDSIALVSTNAYINSIFQNIKHSFGYGYTT
jgi:hypothetical protein